MFVYNVDLIIKNIICIMQLNTSAGMFISNLSWKRINKKIFNLLIRLFERYGITIETIIDRRKSFWNEGVLKIVI